MIKWEIRRALEDSSEALDLFLEGWEPFAVGNESIHFRRQIPQEET